MSDMIAADLISDPNARALIKSAFDRMNVATGETAEFEYLCAIRDCSRELDPITQGDAFDHLSQMAIDVYEIQADLVQGALAQGQKQRLAGTTDAAVDDDDARPPEFSDEALALRFAERHIDRLRYVAVWGKWLIWDGKCWQIDETLVAFNMSRRVCRRAAKDAKSKKLKAAIASAKTVAAVERLARYDRRLAATAEQWDREPWLLNTPAGIIDLRTGGRRQARPDDHITRITNVAPDENCPIQNWKKFLDTVMGSNADLIAFLRRMIGYALTGLTIEHALFFLYGTGGNGKGVFLGTVTGCLGNYHRVAPIETFTASRNERHPTELAGLRGARLVVSQETEEGRHWAEAKIKSLTGGDRIAARFMRQDFFEFVPTFKLVIAGNHKPELRSVDEAIRRRFHLVPFSVTVEEKERDSKLSEKLKIEWPGILAWMIDGCLDWQACDGLASPDVVKDATVAYFDSEDTLAAWILDETECNPESEISTGDLYRSFKSWATRSGEFVIGAKTFAKRLEEKGQFFGMKRCRDAKMRGFRGRQLKQRKRPDDTCDTCPG